MPATALIADAGIFDLYKSSRCIKFAQAKIPLLQAIWNECWLRYCEHSMNPQKSLAIPKNIHYNNVTNSLTHWRKNL